jgi:hypothetical protein
MQMPRWYATACDGWSRAAWHGEIAWEHAAALVEVWHPIALGQALAPGRKRCPDREQQLELELYAGLLASGVDEFTARHLVGLDEVANPTPPRRGKEEFNIMKCARCRTDLARVKLNIGGYWLCADCAYELEYGEVERKRWPLPKTTAPPQAETLFPLPPAVKPKGGSRAGVS